MIDETGALAPYSATLHTNLDAVRALSQQTAWEAMRTGAIDFGRLASIRKCDVPEKKEYVQALRKKIVNGIRAKQEKFSLPSAEALADLRLSGDALQGLLTLVGQFSERYQRAKLQRHVLDYNDLEHDTFLRFARTILRMDLMLWVNGRFAGQM